jgi:hypothetical protein
MNATPHYTSNPNYHRSTVAKPHQISLPPIIIIIIIRYFGSDIEPSFSQAPRLAKKKRIDKKTILAI